MKKVLIFIPLLVLCASIFPHLFTHAQEQQSLSLPERAARQQQDLARFFRRHERVKFNTNEVAEQVRNNRPLSIYTASASFDLALKPYDMRGKNYRAVEVGADGVERSVRMGPVRTYKGEVIGRDDSQARFTVDDETLEGLIITPEERYMVEPMGKYSALAEPTDFIVYKASDVIEGQAGEGSIDRELRHTAAGIAPQVSEALEMDAVDAVATVRDIEISTEADAEFVSQLGGATGARNEILSIMNMVEGVYQQQLDLTFTVVFQHTWDSAATDPYSLLDPGGCYNDIICGGPPPPGEDYDKKGILNEFMEHWNSRYPTGSPSAGNPRRDVAHMWTGKNVTGTVIGLAWLDVVCSTPTYSYGFSQRLTTTPAKYLVTAHEIGHNLSARHTTTQTGCPNSIMASSLTSDTVLQFCATSINQIKNYVSANSDCLAVGTTPTCTYSITPTSKSFTSAGGNGSVTITATAGCPWSSASYAPWITITSGHGGSGNGTLTYTVAPNTSTTSRTGTFGVASKTFTVTQAGASASVPTLSLLRIGPSTVAGCKSVTGTVGLSAPAPANGVNITISDNLAAARMPTSVSIPAGATSKTFTITTVPVTSTQTGSVTAKLGTVTKTVPLTVRPMGVQIVSLSPGTVVGPASSTGTVFLECAAPAAGIFVSLSSSNPTIAAPTVSSMTILSGATSKTFSVRTVDVAASKSVIIKATANGISKTRTLTIN